MATINLGPKADCIYGRTGATKTSQVGHLAKYIKEKYGKLTRLVSADPGGWGPIAHLVIGSETATADACIIAHHMDIAITDPLWHLIRLTQGWWPDATGKLQQPLMDNIGAYAFEGMTSLASLIMTDLTKRSDISIPGTPKESFVKEGDIKWGFAGQSHYGFIQQRMYEAVVNSNHLPVYKVLWTAHEGPGKEKYRAVYGPKVCGEAVTGENGAWFGSLLHLMPLPKEVQIDDPVHPGKKLTTIEPVPYMFLREHIDPADPYKVPYLAKPRGPFEMWDQWPSIMKPDLGGYYRKMDDLAVKIIEAAKAKGATKA